MEGTLMHYRVTSERDFSRTLIWKFLYSYPSLWETVLILPILKPNADPFLPVSYHPIALSSVLGKLFQKILNKRLLWYLEYNNPLSLFQYGFCKGRNTTQALLDLQSEINEAFVHQSSLYSIFFDLQEAVPRVWRHMQLDSDGIYHKFYKAFSRTENYQLEFRAPFPPLF